MITKALRNNVQPLITVTESEALSKGVDVGRIKAVMRTSTPTYPCDCMYRLVVGLYLEVKHVMTNNFDKVVMTHGRVRKIITDKVDVEGRIKVLLDPLRMLLAGRGVNLNVKVGDADVDLVREIAIRCAWRLVNAYVYRKVTQFTLHMLTESGATAAENGGSRISCLKLTTINK